MIVLDCTQWIKPEYNKHYKTTRSINSVVKDIGSRDDLINWLRTVSDEDQTILFDTLSFSFVCSAIRILVYKKRNILTAKWNLSLLPSTSSGRFSELVSTLLHKDKFILRLMNRFIRFMTEKIVGPPDIALLSGELSLSGSLKQARYKIWAHSFDYDEYLEVERKSRNSEFNFPYIVYLDEDIVNHPDLNHAGLRPVTTAPSFYSRLNRIFRKIEVYMGMPIVIAAHPKSTYNLQSHPFEERVVRIGKTAEIVKNASMVLGHASCSFNYAMLWKKPICVITSNDIEISHIGPWLNARAKITNARIINIDKTDYELGNTDFNKIDDNVYDHYIHQYIKCNELYDEYLWEIFIAKMIEFKIINENNN